MNFRVLINDFFNVAIRRNTGTFASLEKYLQKSQWYSEEQIKAVQFDLLKKILIHSYQTIPFYQKLFKQYNFNPEHIRKSEEINRLPILSKTDVLSAGLEILSNRYPKWLLRKAHTGGTTGTPLNIYRNIFSIGHEHAFVRRQFDWAGIGLSDRVAFLTGRVIVPPDQTRGRLYAYDPFMKELILSTYHLSEKSAKEYIDAIKRYKVKAIAGYPSAVSFLARACLDLGETVSLKAALTSSETLTESMRKTIAQAFSCPVYDFFGSAERVCYIFTCEKGNYHIQPEYGYTELIPLDDTGLCRVVSTGFWNKAMPFIRYDMGDTVVAANGNCSCGRAFPMIKSISGRKADVIKTPSGREFGAAILTHLLYGTDHILESQIIQDRIDHLYIDYVPSNTFNKQDIETFQGLIRHHLPSEIKVDFRVVPAIPKTSSGKIRPVVSLLGS